jgi:hypothetical protein
MKNFGIADENNTWPADVRPKCVHGRQVGRVTPVRAVFYVAIGAQRTARPTDKSRNWCLRFVTIRVIRVLNRSTL